MIAKVWRPVDGDRRVAIVRIAVTYIGGENKKEFFDLLAEKVQYKLFLDTLLVDSEGSLDLTSSPGSAF